MQKKTIFIVNHLWDGHHSIYFKYITKAVIELGYAVCALCPEPLDLEQWIEEETSSTSSLTSFKFFRQFQAQFGFKKLQETARVVSHWRSTQAAIQASSVKLGVNPDLVFFPWLDSYLGGNLIHPVIDAIFPYKWAGIYFQPRHIRIPKRFSNLRLGPLNPHAVLNSANCQSVAVLDDGILGSLASTLTNADVYPFPDFADASTPDYDFPAIHAVKQKSQGRKIVGLLGSLEKRKGILTLLEVAKRNALPNCFFVFAGKLSPQTFSQAELQEIKSFIDTDPENCFFYLDFIPDEPKFNAFISLCDILYVVYNYPHSSNLLTKACIFEKPVIASNSYCIGERVEKYNLGQRIELGSIEDCTLALQVLCNEKIQDNEKLTPLYKTYRELHSLEKLYQHLSVILPK